MNILVRLHKPETREYIKGEPLIVQILTVPIVFDVIRFLYIQVWLRIKRKITKKNILHHYYDELDRYEDIVDYF